MMKTERLALALLILAAGAAPVAAYWLLIGRLPTLTPAAALRRLNAPDSRAALVDVRPAADFAQEHVEGALNWPLAEIRQVTAPAQVPAAYQGQTLLLLCDSGVTSAEAVHRLQASGVGEVFNIRGGLQAWIKASYRNPAPAFTRLVRGGQAAAPAAVPLTPAEQASQAAAFLIVKPFYMLLSLGVALALLRAADPDLAALRWSMLFFFAGEVFCYINILLLQDESYLSEYLHSYGMVLSFAFIFYALLEGLDRRVVRLGAGRHCALFPLCDGCTLDEGGACRAWRLSQFILPLLALLCALPLVARFDPRGYTSPVFMLPYYYTRFGVYQIYENRVLPLLALLCFAGAYVPLWRPAREPFPALTRVLTSAGAGALIFSFGRLALGMIYTSNLIWFNTWEEVTELAFVVGIAATLWIFRRALLPERLAKLKLSLE